MLQRWSVLVVAVSATLACGSPAPPKEPVVSVPRVTQPPPAAERKLAPLSAEERRRVEVLREHVTWLSGEIGERHMDREWQLAEAADGLVERLSSYGYAVERTGVVHGDAVAQNLEVVIRGGKHGTEQVVVGAHYDTHPGSPGADDNASGVAVVLALAEELVALRPSRSLRLVFFCNEEAPHFGQPSMGSLAYVKRLREARADVVGMLSIESVGFYSDAPDSQRYPAEAGRSEPSVGDFVAVVANESSRRLALHLDAAMRKGSLPVIVDVLPEDVPGVSDSDHWAFWRLGYPAVMVTDTAPFRNPNYHQATDLPDTLDYDRMARLVTSLEAALLELLGSDASS